jgi:hypothetical protein
MAIDLDSTLPLIEASTCDPCVRVCPCTPGDYFYNPARCGNEYCGSNGVWGGVSCTVGPGCPACDPCKQMCACTPGDWLFNDAACIVEYCPDNAMWGGWNCVGPGCPEEAGADAGDAAETTGDAQSDDAGLDGSSDAAGDG